MNFYGAFLARPSCASSEKSHVLVVKVPRICDAYEQEMRSERAGLTNSGVRSSAARHRASSARPRRQRPRPSQCLWERSHKPWLNTVIWTSICDDAQMRTYLA